MDARQMPPARHSTGVLHGLFLGAPGGEIVGLFGAAGGLKYDPGSQTQAWGAEYGLLCGRVSCPLC